MTRPKTKAKLGQNFLVDIAAQRAIVAALGDISDSTVLEIGPGQAAITDLLSRRAQRVIAIELDASLAAALRTRFTHNDPGAVVQVIHQDVLTVNLTELSAGEQLHMAVIGNLPFYITSDILLHLFAHSAVLSRAVLMVQREVADRIVAEPGTRDYGMLSATCQLYARVERLFTLPPQAFSPAPQVHSSVVRLVFEPRFAKLGVTADAFTKHLRSCFAQKRKTLSNNLRAAGYPALTIAEALNKAGILPMARAETLTLEEQARLFKALA